LNQGLDETRSLPEWLAIDHVGLAHAVLPEILGARAAKVAVAAATAMAELGIMQRMRGMGAALASSTDQQLRQLSAHRSDTVRGWTCVAMLAQTSQPGGNLEQRLNDTRPFAADHHFGVRELAWMELRPHLARDLPRALQLLLPWATDPDANIRRCASEATRPRGVWCAHLKDLVTDPTPAAPLLTLLRADPARYVQLSVGNWLNDAGKSRPEWVRDLTAHWLRESPDRHTHLIVRRGLRRLTA